MAFLTSLVISAPKVNAQSLPAGQAGVLNLPVPGTLVTTSPVFNPVMIQGVLIHPDNPLKLDFIIDRGDTDFDQDEFKKESIKLIKYFLTSLTVPEKEMWVNLSPYEKDRIIPNGFGRTEMGRDLLAQDYILKQLSASLMHPDKELGQEFWNRVYTKAQEKFNTTDIPMNTFNKIWIVPEQAVVYEHNKGALIVRSYLKVMLEEDYIALDANTNGHEHGLGDIQKDDIEVMSSVTSKIVREVLIPEIEKEVNERSMFSNLRQIYSAVILASWYKQALRTSLLGQVYIDKEKTAGFDTADLEVNEKIYNQYLQAYQKGAYNFIKEDYDPVAQEVIPRKYFSGGADLAMITDIKQVAGRGNFGRADPVNLAIQSPEVQEAISNAARGNAEVVTVVIEEIYGANPAILAKGSPLQFLNTLTQQKNAEFLKGYLTHEGVATTEIMEKRLNSTGEKFHPDTIRQEVKVLKDLEILVPVKGKRGNYRFSDEILSAVSIDGQVSADITSALIRRLNRLDLKGVQAGFGNPLNLFKIKKSKIFEVREAIDLVIGSHRVIASKIFSEMNQSFQRVIEGDTAGAGEANVFTYIRKETLKELGKDFDKDIADHVILQIKKNLGTAEINSDTRRRIIQLLINQANEYSTLVDGFGTVEYDPDKDSIADLKPKEEEHEDIYYAAQQAIDALGVMGETQAVFDLITLSQKGIDAHHEAVGLIEMQNKYLRALKSDDKDFQQKTES